MKINKTELKKFISYFVVGGCAALIEWITFYVSDIYFHYTLSTIISFLIATYGNYVLGKSISFKNYKKKNTDILFVYIVSGIGLLFNILLMYIFVDKLLLNSMISKIIATGIVFFWNYVSRRIFIYKDKE